MASQCDSFWVLPVLRDVQYREASTYLGRPKECDLPQLSVSPLHSPLRPFEPAPDGFSGTMGPRWTKVQDIGGKR